MFTIKIYVNKNKNINIQIYDLSSQLIRDFINLLLKNGLEGLILVLIIFLFFVQKFSLNRIWVAIGIPAATICNISHHVVDRTIY